jgi:hypothetical protein
MPVGFLGFPSKQRADGCSMADQRINIWTGAEEQYSPMVFVIVDREVQQVLGRRGVINLDAAFTCSDSPVSQAVHPLVPRLAHHLLEGIARESFSTHTAPEPYIYEDRGLEPSGFFTGIDCLQELRGRTAPTPVSP